MCKQVTCTHTYSFKSVRVEKKSGFILHLHLFPLRILYQSSEMYVENLPLVNSEKVPFFNYLYSPVRILHSVRTIYYRSSTANLFLCL